jgi:predicted nucleotidyltransferase
VQGLSRDLACGRIFLVETGPEKAIAGLLTAALAVSPMRADVHVAFLFGSAVGATFHPASDVDVAILPVDVGLLLRRELELQAHLERACGRVVDLVRLDRADTLVRWEVARSGLVVLETSPGAASRFRAEAALEHADIVELLEGGAERWRRAVLRSG